jgi:hypothetical protein
MDFQIAGSIMGHWFKAKSVNDRHGHIDDQERSQSIVTMTFDHGETVILAPNRSGSSWINLNKSLTSEGAKRKKIRVIS